MTVPFNESKTKENLMKAFAGESQARNRYTIAAEKAHEQNLYVLEEIFKFTADQEKTHAKVFYEFLTECSGENIDIEGTYPVDISESLEELLGMAAHNENEEHDTVYKEFAQVAKEEGFDEISRKFHMTAEVEKIHAQRFEKFKEWLSENKLFISDVSTKWMCLNCGNTFEAKGVPEVCPLCGADKGYFVRVCLAPYSE